MAIVREWGERQSDGSVVVYGQDENGNITQLRRESWEQNQGLPQPTTTSGQVYQTREGPKTAQQMYAELVAAGGNPSTDPNVLFQMYQNVGAAAPTSNYSGMDLAGGYGLLDPYNQAMNLLSGVQNWQTTATGYMPGGMTYEELAADHILRQRPDLVEFYRANGWEVDSPEARRYWSKTG